MAIGDDPDRDDPEPDDEELADDRLGELELETPVLLIAMPQVLDPFFHKSVVLLIHHQEQGSVGFIVNRPTGIRVAEILSGIEIGWEGPSEARAFFGGPVQPQLGTVFYGSSAGRSSREETSAADGPAAGGGRVEIFPGAVLTQQIDDLQQLASAPPADLRFFLGYAGWDGGQLGAEILRNDWLTAPVRRDLVFDVEPEAVWAAALASVGIDPAQLPAWTAAATDDSDAN